MAKKAGLSKNAMKSIFKELMLYYANNPYSEYKPEELTVVVRMYYDSLKDFDEDVIRLRMKRYIMTEKFFPKICDLIPQEEDYMSRLQQEQEG